jgi:hypothetical protein
MHGRAWILLLAVAAHAQGQIDAGHAAGLLAPRVPHAGENSLGGQFTAPRPALTGHPAA